MEYFVYAVSKGTNNTDFEVVLPQRLVFAGCWECSIRDCVLPVTPASEIYITADFVESSILNDQQYRILHQQGLKRSINHNPLYRSVTVTELQRIRLKIVRSDGTPWIPRNRTAKTHILLHYRAV